MPKVLIVIARLNVGGTAQYIGELVKGLKGSKYEVLVATGHVQGAEVEDQVVSEMPIVRIPSLGRRISPLNDWRARADLKRVIKDFQPDLFYSHTFKAGLISRSIRDAIPRVHAFHGHLLSEPELQGWKSRVVVWLERWLALKSKLLVTVGQRVADELLKVGVGNKAQYRSIAPGVVPLVLEDREKARKELGIAEEVRPIVVWMARVTAVKAPQRVKEIAKLIPEARFLLAGGGDMLDEVSQNLPENLTVLGWQPATKMWAVADLAISTSENEGMPVALIEAQLAGVPAVAVNVGSVGEVIADGDTGFLFDEFGSDYIFKVRQLVLGISELIKLGRAAEERAKAQFSPQKLINSHVALFEEILGR
jgi:glycosyltransferase involved in cell wall biosynthesis